MASTTYAWPWTKPAAVCFALADQEQPLHCSFQVSPAKIEVRVRVSVRHPNSTLDTGGFGWRFLTCLTDEASTTREGDELQIRVTKTAPCRR
jgi:hypothetical protein